MAQYQVFNPNNEAGMSEDMQVRMLPVKLQRRVENEFRDYLETTLSGMYDADAQFPTLSKYADIKDLRKFGVNVSEIMDEWAISWSFDQRRVSAGPFAWLWYSKQGEQIVATTQIVSDRRRVNGRVWEIKASKWDERDSKWSPVFYATANKVEDAINELLYSNLMDSASKYESVRIPYNYPALMGFGNDGPGTCFDVSPESAQLKSFKRIDWENLNKPELPSSAFDIESGQGREIAKAVQNESVVRIVGPYNLQFDLLPVGPEPLRKDLLVGTIWDQQGEAICEASTVVRNAQEDRLDEGQYVERIVSGMSEVIDEIKKKEPALFYQPRYMDSFPHPAEFIDTVKMPMSKSSVESKYWSSPESGSNILVEKNDEGLYAGSYTYRFDNLITMETLYGNSFEEVYQGLYQAAYRGYCESLGFNHEKTLPIKNHVEGHADYANLQKLKESEGIHTVKVERDSQDEVAQRAGNISLDSGRIKGLGLCL